MDYENCDVYEIKGSDGVCSGNDSPYAEHDEKCDQCPLYARYKEHKQRSE